MSSHIDYHRFSHSEGCTEEGCRSKKWYIEDGKKFCQRGHEQTDFTQTQQDEDDWNTAGKTTRKKREEKEKVQTVFSGKEAVDLYLQCYQLILWKQCFWLVQEKGFPEELETVVRDLWGLRIRLLFGTGDEERAYGSGTGILGFSSQSDRDNSDTDGATSRSSRLSKKSGYKAKESKLPRLLETLAMCYLGILLLRLPTSLGEIHKWVATDDMVYNRAIKEIPKEMRRRLPGPFHGALQIKSRSSLKNIHGAVLDMVEFYNFHFDMVFPPLNSPLLIYKHVRDLGLPIEIYPAVRRLATILDIDFTYPILHKKIYRRLAYPEIQLMCLIVVATKLNHPFDDIVRVPEDESDPSTVKIDWAKWAEVMAEHPCVGLKRGDEWDVKDTEVFEMSEKQLDDYLDWHQRTWYDDRDPKIAQQLLDHGPLPELSPRPPLTSDPKQSVDRLRQVQYNLIVQKPSATESIIDAITRPGELYKRYRTVKELPTNARIFYEIAAKNVGMSLNGLVRGVFETEVQLENWRITERKKRLMEQSD